MGFFLTRKNIKDLLKSIASTLFAFALVSFWLLPFISGIFQESAIPSLKQGTWIWNLSLNNLSINLSVFLIPLAFIILFFLFYKGENKTKSNLLFFLPVFIFSLLFFLRLTPFFPIFDQIYPDPIVHFILFFAIFFFLKMEIPQKKARLFSVILLLGIIASITLNILFTPLFNTPDSEREKEFIDYIPLLQERFVMVGKFPPEPYTKAFYSFAATKNKSSVSGWYPEEKSPQYISRLSQLYSAIENNDCNEFKQELIYFNTSEILSTRDYCERLKACNFTEVETNKETCFYKLDLPFL